MYDTYISLYIVLHNCKKYLIVKILGIYHKCMNIHRKKNVKGHIVIIQLILCSAIVNEMTNIVLLIGM